MSEFVRPEDEKFSPNWCRKYLPGSIYFVVALVMISGMYLWAAGMWIVLPPTKFQRWWKEL